MNPNKNSYMIESKIQSLQAKIREIESSFNKGQDSFSELPRQNQNRSFNNLTGNKPYSPEGIYT